MADNLFQTPADCHYQPKGENITRDLFILVPQQQTTDEEIRAEFSQWGKVEKVSIIKDATGTPRGFGFVSFATVIGAIRAFEICPPKYKAAYAKPNNLVGTKSNQLAPFYMQTPLEPQQFYLNIIVSKTVGHAELWKLFDMVPAMDFCYIVREYGTHKNEAIVAYDDLQAAIYAKEKIHGMEYPIGEVIIVQLADWNSATLDTSFIEKRTQKKICSIPLPPGQPLATDSAVVAKRLFINFSAELLPAILKHVFSCWAGLIDVYVLPNRKCGFVKYAIEESADKAIKTLDGAVICGSKIKVKVADEQLKKFAVKGAKQMNTK